jgi:hypothetical protein
MSRAAHAAESKAVVRIEVAVNPRPCLGCAFFVWFFGVFLPGGLLHKQGPRRAKLNRRWKWFSFFVEKGFIYSKAQEVF